MAWEKLAEDTLTTSGDKLDNSGFDAKTFLQVLTHTLDTGGTIGLATTFNNISTAQYAFRRSNNGGTDGTFTSQTNWSMQPFGDASDKFSVMYGMNISGEEKLFIESLVSEKAAGASTAPDRRVDVAKFVVTSGQVTQVEIDNVSAGSYDTDSNMSVLGTD